MDTKQVQKIMRKLSGMLSSMEEINTKNILKKKNSFLNPSIAQTKDNQTTKEYMLMSC